MKHSCSPLLSLLFLIATALILAKAPALPAASATAAMAKKLNWDDKFEGVVHDARKIGGFVAEYRWLSNYFPCRVEWEGRVYGSAEAAYQSGKYPRLTAMCSRSSKPTRRGKSLAPSAMTERLGRRARCGRCARWYGRNTRRILSLQENFWRRETATSRRQIGGAIRFGAFIEARGRICSEKS